MASVDWYKCPLGSSLLTSFSMSPSVLTLLLLSLLTSPSLSCHSCICEQCGGSLEVYRGTNLVLNTNTTRVGLRNITVGADTVYLVGCGCFMIFTGQGKFGRAQKVSEPGLQRLDRRVRVGAIYREQVRPVIAPNGLKQSIAGLLQV